VAKKNKKKKITKKQQSGIRRFYRETVGELRKVTWPTWEEARRLTWIVLVVITAMAFFLTVFDALFNRMFALILGA
jgi:preprotein translocase subunit SecE